MPADSLVFDHLVDALFLRGLSGQVTPPLRARLFELGLDLDKLLPAYPVDAFRKALEVTRVELFARMGVEEGMEVLGQLAIQGYEQTPLGSKMLESVRMVGPRRALERLPTLLRTIRNVAETKIDELAPRDVQLWVADTANAHFMKGLLLGLMISAGAQECEVEVLASSERGAAFHITWSGPSTQEIPLAKPKGDG